MIKLGLPRVSKKGKPRHSLPECVGALEVQRAQ
jgi:hypothetical protein